MTEDDFCRAFCSAILLRPVPIGYVLRTPFRRPDGDAIALYVRQSDDGSCRLEDDGQTIGFLDASGFDIDSPSRFEALSELLKEHDAFFDEDSCLIHSAQMDARLVPTAAVNFAGLLLRLFDLILLAPNRVRSTFRDDLIELVKRQFGEDAQIDLNAPLQPSMRDYVVDIIVRSSDGRALAIYAGTSEVKALEALLFWKEYTTQNIETARAMIVLETAQTRDIRARTLSRVMNSDILLASMDGDEPQIGRKMRLNVLGHA